VVGHEVHDDAEVEFVGALDQALRVCDALARQNSTVMVSGPRAGSAVISADPGRLSQVFINLISNAIKYNDSAKPQVTVRSRIEGDFYVVDIADNGAGVSEEERGRIFDKFYRGRLGETVSFAGAGLGLPISREIVARMQGTLELAADHGEGACFRVKLPLPAGR